MGHRFDTINAVQEVTYAEQNVACISSIEQNVTDIKTQNWTSRSTERYLYQQQY